jgi:hypothetical protein
MLIKRKKGSTLFLHAGMLLLLTTNNKYKMFQVPDISAQKTFEKIRNPSAVHTK